MEKGDPRQLYQRLIEQHGPTPRGVGWADYEEQWLRFQVMMEMVRRADVQPRNLLDVGCGYGELVEWLSQRFQVYMSHADYQQLMYLGVDSNPLAIQAAVARYGILDALPDGNPSPAFMNVDVTAIPVREPRWDVVWGSGVLSYTEMPRKLEILKAMWDFTGQALVFNIRGHETYIADLTFILAAFKSERWAIRHDYKLDETTVLVLR